MNDEMLLLAGKAYESRLLVGTANHAHPAINAVPPMGVMAPNQRGAPNAMAYSEPEKIRMPINRQAPIPRLNARSGLAAASTPINSSPKAWIK